MAEDKIKKKQKTPIPLEIWHRIRSLERNLRLAQNTIVKLKEKAAENNHLKKRLDALRKLKIALESSSETYYARYKTALRISAQEIKEHRRYADACARLYQDALHLIENRIVRFHGKMQITHNCASCGPKPLTDFNVRMLRSGNLGFIAFCKKCQSNRNRKILNVSKISIEKTAENMARSMPHVAEEILERLQEEVELDADTV